MNEIPLTEYEEMKRAYQQVFDSPAGKSVLRDLTRFCRGKMTTKADPILEGRRQVYLRIVQHQELTREELRELFPTLGEYYG
jgi:hypothetical protein